MTECSNRVSLYLVRHGNTFGAGDTPYYVGSKTDLPLTEEGIAQARKVGEYLSSCQESFDYLISGSLARQLQTRDQIASRVSLINQPAN